MARLRVSATKSNLLRLKEELEFAREGKRLLTQKREVLVMELMRLQDDAAQVRKELDELLERAFGAFAGVAMGEGMEGVRRLAMAIPPAPSFSLEERSVMGVSVPIVLSEKAEQAAGYGSARPALAADRAVELFFSVQEKLLEVAEIETAIYRMAVETRKTLRRERALENHFIPQYGETVKFIEETLEEKDRESFYQMKLLKGRQGA